MKSIIEEIEIYGKYVRLVESTIYTYTLYLKKFVHYLSNESGLEPTEIYLHKFRVIRDSNNQFLTFSSIDSDLIDNYFSTIVGNGYNVMNDTYKALNSFFKFLENNYNFKNPMKKVRFKPKDYLPKNDNFKRILSADEIIKFFHVIAHHSTHFSRDNLLFILLFFGPRISEVINLKCFNININENTLTIIKAKNKHQRLVFLTAGMGKAIQTYIEKHQLKSSDYLLYKENHRPLTRKDVNDLKNEYVSLAKIPPFQIKDLRTTFANIMVKQGSSTLFVSQLLGHESLAATKYYIDPHYVRNKNLKIPEHRVIADFLKDKI